MYTSVITTKGSYQLFKKKNLKINPILSQNIFDISREKKKIIEGAIFFMNKKK